MSGSIERAHICNGEGSEAEVWAPRALGESYGTSIGAGGEGRAGASRVRAESTERSTQKKGGRAGLHWRRYVVRREEHSVQRQRAAQRDAEAQHAR